MPMPAQICQIWLPGGMISNWSAFAQIGGSARVLLDRTPSLSIILGPTAELRRMRIQAVIG